MPLLRTRDAEIKAFRHTDVRMRERCFPLIELTRSRRSKKNEIGDVGRHIETLHELFENRPFALDVTDQHDLQNTQITSFLDEDDAFRNWTDFLLTLPETLRITPVIHQYYGMPAPDIALQIRRLEKRFNRFAFRLPVSPQVAADVVPTLVEALDGIENPPIFFLDAKYVPVGTAEEIAPIAVDIIRAIAAGIRPAKITVLASSFPSTVKAKNYGGDSEGRFGIEEVTLDTILRQRADSSLIYGDYATIHPLRYEASYGGWVPRIDYPLERQIIYRRYRKKDGGYPRCAREILASGDYKKLECWGCEQILKAENDDADGRSPTHWIAVRINVHITQQLRRLRAV